jgi:hypothetical protein
LHPAALSVSLLQSQFQALQRLLALIR